MKASIWVISNAENAEGKEDSGTKDGVSFVTHFLLPYRRCIPAVSQPNVAFIMY